MFLVHIYKDCQHLKNKKKIVLFILSIVIGYFCFMALVEVVALQLSKLGVKFGLA